MFTTLILNFLHKLQLDNKNNLRLEKFVTCRKKSKHLVKIQQNEL